MSQSGKLQDVGPADDACVVHQDVQRSETGHGLGHDVGDPLLGGEIRLHVEELSAESRHRLFRLRHGDGAYPNDIRSRFGQTFRYAEAQAFTGSCDNGHLAVESERVKYHLFSPSFRAFSVNT